MRRALSICAVVCYHRSTDMKGALCMLFGIGKGKKDGRPGKPQADPDKEEEEEDELMYEEEEGES